MDFSCNEKEMTVEDVIQNKEFACNEKETIIKDVV